jgi:hypothetical protein
MKILIVSEMSPGTTATVFRARSTLIVRKAAKLPSGNAIVIYLYIHDITVTAL